MKALVGFPLGVSSGKAAGASACPTTPPFATGSYGVPCCWAVLHHCCTVLLPVALWCCSALPKAGSGKKAKEGQEALHATRVGLRNLFSALQTSFNELQEFLAVSFNELHLAAPPEDVRGDLVVEGLAELKKHREQTRTLVTESHKRHLQALRDAVGLRLILLKSRGAFKP